MAVALLLSGAAAMKGSLHGDAPMLEHVKEVEGHGKGHDRTHVCANAYDQAAVHAWKLD